MAAGVAGSIVTTWVTYVPCFLWIFVGAPYIEYLRGRRSLNAALSTITAAVVGVILNLSITFALHTLFRMLSVNASPITSISACSFFARMGIDRLDGTGDCAMAFLMLFRFKIGMIRTLAVSAAIGLAYFFLFGVLIT